MKAFKISRSFSALFVSLFVLPLCGLLLSPWLSPFGGAAHAQTDIHIAGPKAGFPIAIPQLCDTGGGASAATIVPQVISKDLQISGLFNVLNPSSFVETPGKCSAPDQVAFSDWSIVGAEGLVKGQIRSTGGSKFTAELYLFDVQQQRPVIGKRYDAEVGEEAKVAHRFANEIVGFFTGEKGIFGSRIAFVGKTGRFSELFVMDLDGSNRQQLTRDRGLVYSPSWSPSGDTLVYTSYRTRRPELYTISANGGSPRQLTRDGSLKLGTKFLPDGSGLIGANSSAGNSNIVLYDLRGALIRKLTTSHGIDVSPTVSPDGRNYAFCSNRSGGPQIYVGSLAGGDSAQRISFTNSNYCTSPVWSPKGDKIAFVCRSGGNQLFLASPQGGQVTQLTFTGNNEDPTWSPDGRYLAFSSTMGRGGLPAVVILPLNTGVPIPVAPGGTDQRQPSWSPKID